MLKGIDISEFQSTARVPYSEQDFVMIRASYGIGYQDTEWKNHLKKVLQAGKLFGFYHYCYPNLGTSAIKEADWFVSVIKPYIGKAVLALDFENQAFQISDPDSWACAFLTRVFETTGVRPLLYVSASKVRIFKKVQKNNFGLWIAQWGVQKPEVDLWPWYSLWQYRGSPLDLDLWNGDAGTWAEYAKIAQKTTTAAETPKHEEIHTGSKKGVDAVAKEILAGKWGNGKTRFQNLTKAGYTDAEQDEIQKRVNEIMAKTKTKEEGRAIYYTVQPGDSLWAIAQKYNTTWQKLASVNGIKNPGLIYPGQKIRVS